MATVTASSSSHSRPYYIGMSSSSHSTHEHTAQIVSNIRRVAQLEGVEADYKPKDASVNQSLLFNSAVKAIDPPDTEKKKRLSVQVEELTKTINYCRKILISSSLPHRNLKP